MGYYRDQIGELPSELIEPYLQRFLMMQIEAVACGLTDVKEAKSHLAGVEYFISSFGGIHSRLATSNMYGQFIRTPDKELIAICKKAFN